MRDLKVDFKPVGVAKTKLSEPNFWQKGMRDV
jgi:hypothetical protein